ncbi:preprotein translocase subunit SecE [Butyrivibrio sp. ob235]|uniref:preprotein translocase subunit SecE n=1 Tax=unclassified Butyrivibrio TaxID=2639466 RepID=UPI0003B518F1|nr:MULTISPECIES: preprotein translocase subunit SecE [unclassified Butyrivibrio]SEK61135.1 preprotein translocase subunit SecE [Butyrivibrio sp. ob235]
MSENNAAKNAQESKVSAFIRGIKAEFNKIMWPTREDIYKQTTAVVIISVIIGALIAVFDYAFGYLINFITKIG